MPFNTIPCLIMCWCLFFEKQKLTAKKNIGMIDVFFLFLQLFF